MVDNNTTQDNLQTIMTGFDGTMAMIAKTAGISGGVPGEVFAASFGIMNGTITGVISFEGSAQARADLEKAVIGVGAGYLADVLVSTGIRMALAVVIGGTAAAASPVIIIGVGAAAIIAGLNGDGIYDQYTAAQQAFFDWMISNNYDLEISSFVNDFWNSFKNWVAPRADPLVLDLDGDGIETIGISASTHVLFDTDGDGMKTATGWAKSDDGLLVLDRNGNGTIDNGGELFGDQTMVNGVKATDGFGALSAEDTNKNGKFDAGDGNFNNVRVWRDMDSDGVSDSGELFTLTELGIVSINLDSTSSSTNLNGNIKTAISSYTKSDGTTSEVGNLNFSQNSFYSEFTDKLLLSDTAKLLPDMNGSGMVRDLREASMLSDGLTNTLQTMQNQGYVSKTAMMSEVDTLIAQWAETSDMSTSIGQANSVLHRDLVYLPSSSSSDMSLYLYGMSVSSGSSTQSSGTSTMVTSSEEQDKQARYIYLHNESERIANLVDILERFNGETFVDIKPAENKIVGIGSTTVTDGSIITNTSSAGTTASDGSVRITTIPPVFVGLSTAQIAFMEQSYEALKESVYGKLVLQTRLKSYMDEIKFTIDESGIGLDMSGVTAMLSSLANIDIKNALLDCDDLVRFGGAKFDMVDNGAVFELQEWMSDLANHPLILEQLLQLNGLELNSGILHTGSSGDDSINFTSGNNFVLSGSGNDTVTTGSGNNTIYGGDGNDKITTSSGNDTIVGDDGDDEITTGSGVDVITGGAGNDTLNGSYGKDTYIFNRGDGKDTIIEYGYTTDVDTLKFGEGITVDDIVAKISGDHIILALKEDGKAFDELSDKITLQYWYYNANYRMETIAFSDGTILTNNEIITNLLATDGNDIIKSAEIALTLDVKSGDDIVTITNNLANTIYGGSGNDTVTTGSGNNTIYGDSGNDTITTGSGNDTIYGGDGNDVIATGGGADIVVLNSIEGYDSVLDFSVSQDKFQLDSTIFESLVNLQGVLSVDNISFEANTTVAKDENDYIIYNQTNGNIFYDADGSGSLCAAILIADVTNNLALNNTQFVVI